MAMKLSFSTLATPHATGVEAVKLARKHGFHGVDLRVSNNRGELTLDSPPDQITELKTALRGEDIRLVSLMAYNQTGAMDGLSGERMIESIKRHMDLAERAEAEFVRITLGSKPEGMLASDWLERMGDVLSRCLEEASPPNLTLLLQNHYNQINAIECAGFIKQNNHRQLAMALSTDHCLIQNESIPDVLRQAKSVTKQLYVADIIRKKPSYDDVLPGTGEAPLTDFFE